MAIEWVDCLLKKWGEYTAGADSRSLGRYAASIYNPDKVRSTAQSTDLVCLDVMATDIAMGYVKQQHPKLFRVGNEIYVHCLSYELAAGRIRCHINTIYSRRDALHKIVAERLSMRSASR